MTTPITTRYIQKKKNAGENLVMVTAYDATFAGIFDRAGVEMLLVGDSLGMVVQGHDSTLPVTLDHMIYHTAAVRRGTERAQVVGDLPFMSYQVNADQAVAAAGRLVQEGGAHAVKLEGGVPLADTVERIVRAGIPVMGHIGLTPQSVHKLGGFRIQGRDNKGARELIRAAKVLEQAGAYALVLEGIPSELAQIITDSLHIPTIGIGAGPHCGGQVLVCYDLLGMNPEFKPKFLKTYANVHDTIAGATQSFVEEVRAGAFPGPEHSFSAPGLVRANDSKEHNSGIENHQADYMSKKSSSMKPLHFIEPLENEDSSAQLGVYGVPV